MARDLKDSIDVLNRTISNWARLPAGSFNTPVSRESRRLQLKEESQSFKRRAGMVALQDRIKRDYDIIKQSDKLFRAQEFMALHPNAFKSAGDKVRFDEIMAERRKRDRMRGIRADKSFSEQMLAITDPDLAYRKSLEEKFQGASQGADVAADEIIRAERSEKAKKIHSERRKRDRMAINRANETLRFAMLDEDEQAIQGMMKQHGWSRGDAEKVYIKQLTENAKWLRQLFPHSKTLAKNAIPIAKAIGKAAHIPLVGTFLSNPLAGGAAAAIYALAKINKNFEQISKISTKSYTLGVNPAKYESVKRKMEIYGGSAESFFGPAASIMAQQGLAQRGLGNLDYVRNLSALGIKVTGTGLAGLATPQEQMENNANALYAAYQSKDFNRIRAIQSITGMDDAAVKMAIKAKKKGKKYLDTGSDIESFLSGFDNEDAADEWNEMWTKIGAFWDGIFAPKRGDGLPGLIKDLNSPVPMSSPVGLFNKKSKVDQAKEAAISADRYEAGDYAVAAPNYGSNGGGNSTVTLILKTEDGKTVGKRVMKAGEKFTDRVAVADFFDKGE